MARVAVINASPEVYNLACDRIRAFHLARKDEVLDRLRPMLDQVEKVYFSVIFTWDIPALIDQVLQAISPGVEIEIGGPAATFMAKHIENRTGIIPHRGLDQRFEYQQPPEGESYQLTFTSRGCPHKCKFCGVFRAEGNSLNTYDVYPLAPMVGDNNILATSWEHQKMVVARYREWGKEVDFNSGFDVRYFQPRHYKLYSQLRLLCWRFAFDTMKVEKDVKRVARLMMRHGLDRHQVTFYCLVGFPGTTPEEALRRIRTIIELGMNPYPMRFWPLNSLKRDYVAPGWTQDLLDKITLYYQTPVYWRGSPRPDSPCLSFDDFKVRYVERAKEQGVLV